MDWYQLHFRGSEIFKTEDHKKVKVDLRISLQCEWWRYIIIISLKASESLARPALAKLNGCWESFVIVGHHLLLFYDIPTMIFTRSLHQKHIAQNISKDKNILRKGGMRRVILAQMMGPLVQTLIDIVFQCLEALIAIIKSWQCGTIQKASPPFLGRLTMVLPRDHVLPI